MGQRWMDATTVLGATAIDAGSTSYSVALGALNAIGSYGALQITSTATGGIVITQQVSVDGATWIDPTNATMAAAGAVYNSVATVLNMYIPFTPVVAPYIRFKVVPVQTNTITLKYVNQGERM